MGLGKILRNFEHTLGRCKEWNLENKLGLGDGEEGKPETCESSPPSHRWDLKISEEICGKYEGIWRNNYGKYEQDKNNLDISNINFSGQEIKTYMKRKQRYFY